ncbi:MAG: sulfurtransferase [Pseudomonadota bacterium]
MLITPQTLSDHLQSKSGPLVIDCRFDLAAPERGRREYSEGHIPGAVYADLNQHLAGPVTQDSGRHPLPEESAFRSLMATWGVTRDTHIVVYDQGSGAIAARAWWMFRHWCGIESVQMLNGGFRMWTDCGLLLSEARTSVQAVDISHVPRVNADKTVELTATNLGRYRVVDARSRERFLGETEPIDPKAGHIPGSENIPFEQNLVTNAATFISSDELRGRFCRDSAADDRPLVHMCGSGVTACHNMFAMELAGLECGRLYVGSWSAWVADHSNPISPEKSSVPED